MALEQPIVPTSWGYEFTERYLKFA
jgi:hypothetical protein